MVEVAHYDLEALVFFVEQATRRLLGVIERNECRASGFQIARLDELNLHALSAQDDQYAHPSLRCLAGRDEVVTEPAGDPILCPVDTI